jgi:spore coat protein U-like protein
VVVSNMKSVKASVRLLWVPEDAGQGRLPVLRQTRADGASDAALRAVAAASVECVAEIDVDDAGRIALGSVRLAERCASKHPTIGVQCSKQEAHDSEHIALEHGVGTLGVTRWPNVG